MKKWLYLLLFSDYLCIIVGILTIYVLGYAEVYLVVALGVVAVVTGLCVYNTNEFRYKLAPTKKAIIYVDITNYKLLLLHYGKRKASRLASFVNDSLFFNLKRGCINRKGSNQYSVLFEYRTKNEITNYIEKVSEEAACLLNDGGVHIILKFGVQICDEEDYETNETKAEIACIKAKSKSSTSYYIYDDEEFEKLLKSKK